MFTKKVYNILLSIVVICLLAAIIITIYNTNTPTQEQVSNTQTEQTTGQVIYEVTELKSQKDFKLVGQRILLGTGFGPGFNFQILASGGKFGTEIVSQNGNSYYVGYLDLTNNSTSTKVFSGKMLDKQDKIVEASIQLFETPCKQPDGVIIPLTAAITVGEERLGGCAGVVTN